MPSALAFFPSDVAPAAAVLATPFPQADPTTTPAVPAPAGTDLAPGHPSNDIRPGPAGGDPLPTTVSPATPTPIPSSDREQHDALLLVLADALDDLEQVRIASANRLRALRDVKGLGGSRAEHNLSALVGSLAALEHQATLDLQRAMRAHPLGPWVTRTVGVGEKQAARLLAAIGWPGDRDRPAQLWQFCGHGDPARSRLRRGERATFSPNAKFRTYLIAASCMKQMRSPYRAVYDAERAKWADRDTTDAHRHAHALRVVGKRVLLDLWREARAIDNTTLEAR